MSLRLVRSVVSFIAVVAVALGLLQVVASAAPPPSAPAPADPIDASNVAPLPDKGGAPAPLDPGVIGDMTDPPVESVIPVEADAEVPKQPSGYDPAKSKLSERSLMYDLYDNPDGTKTAIAYLEPVNAEKADGSYAPVDLDLVSASAKDAPAAASAKVAGVEMTPSSKTKNHPLKPVFGSDASAGAVAVSADDVSMSLTPVDAPKGAKAKKQKNKNKQAGDESVSDDAIVYPKASGGSDVAYEVTTGAVKESIIVQQAPGDQGAAEWSYWLAVDGENATPIVTDTGAVEVRKPDGTVVFGLPKPYVFDSSGKDGQREAADINGVFTLEQDGARWKLTIAVDRAWLNDPARVYPVTVDPTVAGTWYDSAVSYKTDGTTVQGQIKSGNPNEPGGSSNRWRGLAHFNISSWLNWGHQVVSASVYLQRTGGTANGYGQWLWHAGSFSYGGLAEFLGSTGSYPDSAEIEGAALTNYVRSEFNASSSNAWYTFVGDESAGIYSYKTSNVALYVDLNVNAQAPTLAAPADGASNQPVQTSLSINPASDPEGDQVWYQYVVSPNADMSNAVWISDWTTSTQMQIPSNKLWGGTKYYWRVYSRDVCHLDQNYCGYGAPLGGWWSATRSFTTNLPPPGVGGITSPENGAKTATTTPTLSVLPSGTPDPDGPQPVKYWFSIATGANGQTGVVMSSGWITASHWKVPEGYLKDGVTYTWRAWSYDGVDRDQSVWSNKLTIDQRIGDPKTSPVDSLGAVTANLANGNVIFTTSAPTTTFATSSVAPRLTYNSQAKPDENGLTVTYFKDTNKNGLIDDGADAQLMSKTEPVPTGDWTNTSPLPGVIDRDYWIAQWTGFITVPTSGQYVFGGRNDDAIKVVVDGAEAYAKACCRSVAEFSSTSVAFTAGVPKPVTITLSQATGPAYMDVQIKRQDGAALWSGGPAAASMPTAWLTPTRPNVLPPGWTFSVDLDESPQYSRAVVSQDSITVYDAAATPHIYTRAAAGTTGGWNSPPDENAVLTLAGDGTITVLDEDGSSTMFNKDGTLASFMPDSGDAATALRNTYSAAGLLTAITDPVSDQKVSFVYGPDPACYDSGWPAANSGLMTVAPIGKLCRIKYPDNTATQLIYFADSGRLAGVDDPGGEFTNFGYDGNGRLWGIRDPLANDALTAGKVPASESTSLLSYYGNNTIAAIESPVPASGKTRLKHTYSYQSPASPSADGVTLVKVAGTNPASGYNTKVTYNNDYRATSSTDALGRVATTEYNAKDLLVKTTSQSVINGDVTTMVATTIYNAADRPTAKYGPAPASCFDGYKPTPACASTVQATTTDYDQGLNGLHVDWWNNPRLAGQPTAKTLAIPGAGGALSVNWGTAAPAVPGIGADNFSLRATGYLTFGAGGNYSFSFSSDNLGQVWVNNQLLTTADYTTPSTFVILDVPAGAVWPIRIQYREETGNAGFNLQWQPPGGSMTPIPTSALSPGYGLATTQTTADSGGGAPSEVTVTSYGPRPWEGLTASTTVDPGGLALTTSMSYDSLKRRTTRTLPSGATYTDTYYGTTETRSNPCVAGSAAVNQAGRLKTNTSPANSDGYAVVREYVYDAAGRVIASRIAADGDGGWTCSQFDARGRTTQIIYPATVDDPATPGVDESSPARTVSSNYAVGGDPRVSSVGDAAGTITTTTDLTGKVTIYTDTAGVTTTTSYDAAGRATGETSTSPGGGVSSVTALTYNDASQITSTSLDGQVISTPVINSGTGEVTGAAYANGTSSTLTRDTGGRLSTLAWSMSDGRSITSTVTRSRSGRVLTDTATDNTDPGSGYAWSYGYDTAGRLSTANLAAQPTSTNNTNTGTNGTGTSGAAEPAAQTTPAGGRPAVALTYGFDTGSAAAGCAKGAGKNTNRGSQTRTVTGAQPVTVTSCYDNADRVLNDSSGTVYSYDKRGNTTRVTSTATGDVTIFVYDSADRHVKTVTPNGAGGTATVAYTRDATGRITTRTAAGSTVEAENGSVAYGFTASGDSPDVYLAGGGGIGQRVIGADGGATFTKNYTDAANSAWAYPNIHGDNITTSTGASGAPDAPITCYDPYGTPITSTGVADAKAVPNTAPGAFDAGWLGQHQRYTEHAAALNYLEMGQRVYNPATGRFMQIDPIEGGSANDYDYTNANPSNALDLDGTRPTKLKKGERLSCGKGRYAYSFTNYQGTYWDCASKAGKKAKAKNRAVLGKFLGTMVLTLPKFVCRVSVICGIGVGAASGAFGYTLSTPSRKRTFGGYLYAIVTGAVNGVTIGSYQYKGLHYR